MLATTSALWSQPTLVLVAEDNDVTTPRKNQLAAKVVTVPAGTIGGSGLFTLTSLGPTGLAALTCAQIQAFHVVYVPITSGAERDAIKNNPAFAQCFQSSERAVLTGYHAEDHENPATGQFLFDALTWIRAGSQVGLLVLNDTRAIPAKYNFLQPIFPGAYASVLGPVFAMDQITFLTTPPHPIHTNTSDGVQNIGLPTMDNWSQTCHTAWNTFGPGGGGFEDDRFVAVSTGTQGATTAVCAIAKDGAIAVPVDIKPQSCPNPLNVGDRGVLPVAILGTATFAANQVNPGTVQLESVFPLRSSLEDVATPFQPFIGKKNPDDCTTAGPDGFVDLSLKFDAQTVVGALGLVTDGEVRVLKLTGKLFNGTNIIGEDVVVMIKK